MASLKDLLPAPTDEHTAPSLSEQPDEPQLLVTPAPTSPKAGVSKVLTLAKDPTTNELDYSAVIRQGENASRILHTTHDALVEKPLDEAAAPMPTADEVDDTTERTRNALQRVVESKTTLAARARSQDGPTFLRYTPASAAKSPNGRVSSGHQRVVKMVTAQVDPMEPPRFRQRKAPANPPSPPVPVLHSPERKASKEEQRAWNIPPVVSDWKNNRGYTISLDKRLASDGRGMVDHSINDRFASMAEALFQAERTARRDVEMRAGLQRQVSIRAKAARERELRDLADKARRERQGYLSLSDPVPGDDESSLHDEPSYHNGPSLNEEAPHHDQPPIHNVSRPDGVGVVQAVEDEAPPQMPAVQPTGARRRRSRFASAADASDKPEITPSDTREDEAAAQRRDAVRRERRELREREMRLGDEGDERGGKRGRLTRDRDRDVTERAALGQRVTGGGGGGGAEVLYDERLFTHDGSGRRGNGLGLGTGFGAEDAYTLYETPLFKGADERSRARWRGSAAGGGTHASRSGGAAGGEKAPLEEVGMKTREREGAVEFEKDNQVPASTGQEDAYGLNKFFDEAKRAVSR